MAAALDDALDGEPPVPVTGAGVFTATAPVIAVTHPQPFSADLVVAQGRVPRALAGEPITARWVVREVVLGVLPLLG